MSALAGLVLAGGWARRFGSDKLLVEVDGLPLLARAVAACRDVCDGPVLVASGDGLRRPGVADGQVADVVADGGPLAGIAAGLLALREYDAVAVVAGDHVAPSAELLRVLAAERGRARVAHAVVAGRAQPLQAVWSTSLAEPLADDVRDGVRSVLGWLSGQHVVVLDEDELRARGVDPGVTADVDEPGDLPGDVTPSS